MGTQPIEISPPIQSNSASCYVRISLKFITEVIVLTAQRRSSAERKKSNDQASLQTANLLIDLPFTSQNTDDADRGASKSDENIKVLLIFGQ